ncbi:MAG: dihydrofolate reductase [Candidatus Taylorbacteria bacterium]|nr:dihydrofolate reductase [Candidatus Taylorbacteria bacterium]
MPKSRRLTSPPLERGRLRGGATFTLIAAVSLDGRITAGKREGSEWTSKEDKKFFQSELDKADAVIMGRKTFEAIPRPLKPRNRIVFTHRDFVIPSKDGIQSPVAFKGSVKKLIGLLKRNAWTRIAVVGGTSIYGWFLEKKLIDELYITVEPVIFGSGKLLTANTLSRTTDFTLQSMQKLNKTGTVLLHYKNSKKV